MKNTAIVLAALLVLAAAGLATAGSAPGGDKADKLPKCSGALCKSVGCSPDVLCVRGAAVVSCAEVCGGH